MLRNALILAAALAVSACVTDTGGDDAGGDATAGGSTEPAAEFAQCTANGGTVERRGMRGSEMCVMPYADAGKVCTDASQCEGSCLAEGRADPSQTGQGAKGICQADDKLFGCVAFIKKGVQGATICID